MCISYGEMHIFKDKSRTFFCINLIFKEKNTSVILSNAKDLYAYAHVTEILRSAQNDKYGKNVHLPIGDAQKSQDYGY